MTNYEKIKSMSVNEMAEFLMNFVTEALTNPKCVVVKNWLESETEPTYCKDKQNNLVHCEDCHTGDCDG